MEFDINALYKKRRKQYKTKLTVFSIDRKCVFVNVACHVNISI